MGTARHLVRHPVRRPAAAATREARGHGAAPRCAPGESGQDHPHQRAAGFRIRPIYSSSRQPRRAARGRPLPPSRARRIRWSHGATRSHAWATSGSRTIPRPSCQRALPEVGGGAHDSVVTRLSDYTYAIARARELARAEAATHRGKARRKRQSNTISKNQVWAPSDSPLMPSVMFCRL